jgi:hypothetical protein
MCTTKKNWNRNFRIATNEERKLFLFKKETYLAPAYKPLNQLFKIGYSFPEMRVKELLKEFS